MCNSLGYDSKELLKENFGTKSPKKHTRRGRKKEESLLYYDMQPSWYALLVPHKLLKWYTTPTNSKELFIEDQSITITNSKNEKQSLESNDNHTITNKSRPCIAIQTGNH